MRYFLLLSFLLLFSMRVAAQDLLTGLRTSPYTYIYALTNEQASQAYADKLDSLRPAYFTAVVDSFPTDEFYSGQLPLGNYLRVHAEGSKLVVMVESVRNVRLELLPDPKKLVVVLYDEDGALLENAALAVDGKPLRYHQETKTYQLPYSKKYKLLSVVHKGISNFFQLQSPYSNYRFPGTLIRKFIYARPVYFLWSPFQDVVRSISWGDYEGWLRIFDSSLDWEERWGETKQFRGYLSLNQPVYRNGDTVFFKAFVLKRLRPFRKELVPELRGKTRSGYESITFPPLEPYRPGAYEGYLVLHDSLGLLLDTYPELSFTHRRHKIEEQFKLEDYELKGNNFSISASSEKHVQGAPPTLTLRASDVNGLPLLGAEVQLYALPTRIGALPAKPLIVPDTLWRHKLMLEPNLETQIQLSDSMFSPVWTEYTLHATLKTTQQEYLKQHLELQYAHQDMLDLQLKGDSLFIQWLKNGISVPMAVDMQVEIPQEELTVQEIMLPYAVKVDPRWQMLSIDNGPVWESIVFSREPSLVQHAINRSADSVFVHISSGRNIPYWYTLYRGNKRKHKIASGYSSGEEVMWADKGRRNSTYHLQLRYLWAGEIQQELDDAPLLKKLLEVSLEVPTQVVPGEKTDLSVVVKDYKGTPVEAVDVTAFAYNKKMPGSMQPEVPYLGRERQYPFPMKYINMHEGKLAKGKKLDWTTWQQRLGLDSIAFYQFLYPQQQVVKQLLPTADSSTQIAPFFIKEGEPQQVHIVYLNDVPIYYSEVATERAYSFMVNPLQAYKLKMRTARHLITLDSVRFAAGQKTILSLGGLVRQPGVKVEEMLPELSQEELQHLNRYLIVINHTYNQHYTYLEQHEQVQLINRPSRSQYAQTLLAGPFTPSRLTYQVVDQFETSFPLEPGHHLRINPELVYAKEVIPEGEGSLDETSMYPDFDEMAITRAQVWQQWQEYLQERNRPVVKYEYPESTLPGAGRIDLEIKLDPAPYDEKIPILKEIVVLGITDSAFVRVYPRTQLHDLVPGSYTLIGIFDDSTYYRSAVLPVAANATTYLKVVLDSLLPNDVYIGHIRRIMEKSKSAAVTTMQQLERELSYINQVGRMRGGTTGTQLLEGTVMGEDEVPLPGVAIRIKGTNSGTVTDIDGNYRMYINPGDELVFSYIGYAEQAISPGRKQRMEVVLIEDIERLEEVVVTAFGVDRTTKTVIYAAAVSDLSGMVAGVQVSGAPGSGYSIMVRGASSLSGNSQPLIIIDGVPFDGSLGQLNQAEFSSIAVLKGAEATAIYGSRGANGVIVVTTGDGLQLPNNTLVAPELLAGVDSQQNSLRTNFRDWAFWQPRLQTDAAGRASFTVIFPDNITAWETKLLAMGPKRHSGQLSSSIRAVKPLWAALGMPRFLLSGDSALVYGQVSRYTKDTVQVNTRLTIGDQPPLTRTAAISTTLKDSSWVSVATADSLTLTYEVLEGERLLDGERRKLPVYRTGIAEARGEFVLLHPDSSARLALPAGDMPWQLQAFATQQEPLLQEVDAVLRYAYYCNEQAASKLYALLLLNNYRQQQGGKSVKEAHTRKLIKQLQEAQREDDGMWGWWSNNGGEFWITKHIIGALQLAQEQGYNAAFDQQKLLETLHFKLKSTQYAREQLQLLEVLTQLKAEQLPYQHYIPLLEDSLRNDELARLRLLRLRAAANMPYTAADVLALKHETMLGAYYWGEEEDWYPTQTSVVATAWAYQLLKQLGAAPAAAKAELYLWTSRNGGNWRNTYESAQALLQLMPLLSGDSEPQLALELKTDNQTQQLTASSLKEPLVLPKTAVVIRNEGNSPVFVSASTEYWVNAPEASGTDFVITTSFSGNRQYLTTGEAVTLEAKVVVKKAAEFVMVEIPIPAGCTYEDKGRHWSEVHREYYRDRVVVFCRKLPEGEHSFNVNLLPRFKGTYTLNPAQVSLMYFPTFFGRTGLKQVVIK